MSDLPDPDDAVLVVLDMQRDLLLAADGTPHEWGVAAVRATADAVRLCRGAGVPVVWVTVQRRADYADVAGHVTDRNPAGRVAARRILVTGTDGAAIVDGLDPRSDDFFVAKPRVNAFHGTNLAGLIGRLGRRTLWLAGVYTEMAVEATARAAYDLDLDGVVLADCCASPSAKAHEASIGGVLRSIARVRTVAEVTPATVA